MSNDSAMHSTMEGLFSIFDDEQSGHCNTILRAFQVIHPIFLLTLYQVKLTNCYETDTAKEHLPWHPLLTAAEILLDA